MTKGVHWAIMLVIIGGLVFAGLRLGLDRPYVRKWRVWLFGTICGAVVALTLQLLLFGFAMPFMLLALALGAFSGSSSQ